MAELIKFNSDEDAVNYIASVDGIALFGKYTTVKLCDTLKIDDYSLQSLIRLGFANSEHVPPLNSKDEKYVILYEFNDRWRNLKRFLNYAEFIEWEKSELIKGIEKIDNEREFVKSQVTNIQSQNELMPLLKASNDSTIKTNRTLIWVFSITMEAVN